MKANEPGRKMMSGQIETSIWDALDRMAEDSLETKRSHLERALLMYVDPGYFEFEDDWNRLAEKYGVEK